MNGSDAVRMCIDVNSHQHRPTAGVKSHGTDVTQRLAGKDGHAEWVISQPTGIVEVLVAKRELDFHSTSITCSPTAKSVTQVRRALVLDGDTLSYEVHMAAVGQPMQWHLSARLHRDD